MTLQERSSEEIKAYIDGYNACFKEFEKQAEKDNYLDKAIYKVGILKTAVNACIDKGENK